LYKKKTNHGLVPSGSEHRKLTGPCEYEDEDLGSKRAEILTNNNNNIHLTAIGL